MPGISDLGARALRWLPPETAHGVALGLLRRGLVAKARAASPPSLHVNLWGLEFSSPLGLAAGFDKDGVALAGLYRLFVEKDASQVEINPLVVTGAGEVIALDAKMNFDDNALYRHTDVLELRDEDEEDPMEIEAARHDIRITTITTDYFELFEEVNKVVPIGDKRWVVGPAEIAYSATPLCSHGREWGSTLSRNANSSIVLLNTFIIRYCERPMN